MDVEEEYDVDEVIDYDDGMCDSASQVWICTDDRAYVESAEELQAEEPENKLGLNDDRPNSGAFFSVELFVQGK